MDPEPCSLNVAGTTDPGFTYANIIDEAVSRINGGNGVDIDEIADYVKERYELPKDFRRRLKNKLKNRVSDKKLDKVGEVFKIPDGAVTKEATNPTQSLKPEGSTKPQDQPSTPEKFMKATLKIRACADYFEREAREMYQLADDMDLLPDMIMVAVATSTSDGGNAVHINAIAEFIKERYQVVKSKKLLIAKLDKLVSEKRLDKIENRYKIHKGAGTTKATNPTQNSTPEDSTKPVVSEDMPEELTDKLRKLDSGNKVDEILDGAVTAENSNTQQDLPTSSSALVDGAATTEATNPTQISNAEDSNKQQDLPSTPRIPARMLEAFINDLVRIIASVEHFELRAREISKSADIADELYEHTYINLLFAEQLYEQSKKGIQVPLVEFTEDIFAHWLLLDTAASE